MMKRINEQSDSSSSDNEIPASNLKEAIDKQFLSDNLYITKEVKLIPQSGTNELKSLRHSKQEDKFTNFGVSATFQSFVAKKLDEILEGTIKLKNSKTTESCMEQKRKKNKNSGIKLLSTSKKFLTTKMEVRAEYKEKPRKYQEIVEDDDTLSKFREVAVSPEHILSKSDTKAWANKCPEPEFKYKRLKDGTLIAI